MNCPACMDIPPKAKNLIRARIATLVPGGEGASIIVRLDAHLSRDGKLTVKAKVDPDEKSYIVREVVVDSIAD